MNEHMIILSIAGGWILFVVIGWAMDRKRG